MGEQSRKRMTKKKESESHKRGRTNGKWKSDDKKKSLYMRKKYKISGLMKWEKERKRDKERTKKPGMMRIHRRIV